MKPEAEISVEQMPSYKRGDRLVMKVDKGHAKKGDVVEVSRQIFPGDDDIKVTCCANDRIKEVLWVKPDEIEPEETNKAENTPAEEVLQETTIPEPATVKNPFIGDNYFTDNPDHILGTQTIQKGRYGSEWVKVEGTLSDLQRIDVPVIKRFEPIEDTANLSTASIQTAITETIENEKEVLIKPKVKRIRKKKEEADKTSAQEIYSIRETSAMYNTNISREELEAYFFTKNGLKGYDYSVYFDGYTFTKEDFIQKGLIAAIYNELSNSFNWEYIYTYKSGNISKKISRHKKYKEEFIRIFGDVQFEKQLKWLEECRPKPKAFIGDDKIILLPHANFSKEIYIQEIRSNIDLNGDTNLLDAFIDWLRFIPASEFKKSQSSEIIDYYLRNKSIPIDRKAPKEQQERQEKSAINIRQRTKEEGDELFSRFLNEELLTEDQAKIAYLWNEKYNSITEADLTKIPVGFRISKTFKDNAPLKLSPTQRQAVAFLMEKKSGLLAYGVGVGKGHLLTSDILTPTGYRKMGDLKIGDEVISVEGTATKVTGVFPLGKIQCYEIIMSDGSKTKVSKDHLWKVQKIKNRENKNGLWHIIETEELMNHGLYTNRGEYYYSIPMAQAVQFIEQDLPIHPYLLGVLIGDGCLGSKSTPLISNTEPDIIDKIKRLLPGDVSLQLKAGSTKDWYISRKANSGENTFTNKIRGLKLNVHSYDKFIPDIYKFSSIEQRLELLRGLLDTDGYIASKKKDGKKGCYMEYCTTSEQLANDVRFLVESFGGTVNIKTKLPKFTYNNELKIGKLAYMVGIRLPKGIIPVSSIKQLSKFIEKSKYQPVRFIADIKDIGLHEAQCISVEHSDHLYLCENFIVTHNTLSSIACISQAIDNGLAEFPLIVVPTNTYFKWLGDLQGYTDKDSGKYLQGALPHLPKIVGLFNLNADIVRNDIKEYSEEDNKILTSLELLIETLSNLEADDFADVKLQKKLSDIYPINWQGINAAYIDYTTGLKNPMSAVKWVKDYYRTELNYKIYELGRIKSFPSGTIFITTEVGIQKLGIRPEHQGKLQSDLYTILSQGEEAAGKESGSDIAKLELKIEQTIASSMKKAKLYIEDFKFDFVCFDESHYYKKIFTYVKGSVKDTEEDERGNKKYKRDKSKYELKSGSVPSSRALSAFVLSHFIQRENDNRNVLHLTATPFTNSPLEIYSMLALTNYRALEDLDMANMIDFFDTFMKINYDIKYTASKTVVKDVVLTGFNNLTSLRGLIYSLIDKKDEGANIIRPDKHILPSYEKGIETTIPMTLEQDELMKDIKQFIQDPSYAYGDLCESAIDEEINELDFEGMTDDQLVYTYNTTLNPEEELIVDDELTDNQREDLIKKIKGAKKGIAFSSTDLSETESQGARILQALSAMRQVTLSPYTWNCKRNPELRKTLTYTKYIESSPKLKYVMGCIKSVLDYHRSKGTKPSGQVIYMNAGVEFFPYIKEYLVKELGLSEAQVGMVTGGMSKGAKENAKRMFLNGDILVLIGSATISVGVDLQNNASVLYNCYYDWNPTDAQQIEGRIWRQGNKYSAVRIVYPMCYNSVDPVMFQYLQEKTSRINEIWNRDGRISELDLRDFNPKQLQKDLITDPEEKADWEILEISEKISGEIIYLENRLSSIEDAQYSISQMEEDRPEIKKLLTEISKKRAEIKREEGKVAYEEKREAIMAKYRNDSAKMTSELAKHQKTAYDHDTDPEKRYMAKNFTRATDEELYNECKRTIEWLTAVNYNKANILGDIFYRRSSIIDKLKSFRGNFKDYRQLVDKVLLPLNIDITNISNPIGEVRKKLEEKREQLANLEASKPERVKRFQEEQAAKRFNVTIEDRVKEFSNLNYLLDKQLPDAIIPKLTLEQKLILFRTALLKKLADGGPTKKDHDKAKAESKEQKTVNTKSQEGLMEAAKLQKEGWKIVGSDAEHIHFERNKYLSDKKKNGGAIAKMYKQAQAGNPNAYVMILHGDGNPDKAQYAPVSNPEVAVCNTLDECRTAAMAYIEKWDLGGGNWDGGGIIYHPTKGPIAIVSYNGRIWEYPSEWNKRKEITTGLDIPIEQYAEGGKVGDCGCPHILN